MRVGTAFAAWGVACALALTGCSGGGEEAGGPRPSGPPAASSSTPTPPPDGGPPQLPALAREHTNAGAKAFVRYYVDVLNYATQTSSPRELDELSPPRCDLCASFVEVITRVRRNGGHQRGGEFEIRDVGLASADEFGTRLFIAAVTVREGMSQETANSQPIRIRPTRFSLEFHLLWRNDGWHLTDLRLA